MHFFIKQSKTDQMVSAQEAGTCVQLWQWRPTENAAAVALTPHLLSTSKMGGHSHLRASAPPFYPWYVTYGGAMWLQSSQIQHSHWRIVAARAGLPTDTIQKLRRWRSKVYQTWGAATVHVNSLLTSNS